MILNRKPATYNLEKRIAWSGNRTETNENRHTVPIWSTKSNQLGSIVVIKFNYFVNITKSLFVFEI